jgi:hypothetical protein
MRYQALRSELQAIASDQLGAVLEATRWSEPQAWTRAERDTVRAVVESELAPHGLLSLEQARATGESLALVRAQARAMLLHIDAHGARS